MLRGVRSAFPAWQPRIRTTHDIAILVAEAQRRQPQQVLRLVFQLQPLPQHILVAEGGSFRIRADAAPAYRDKRRSPRLAATDGASGSRPCSAAAPLWFPVASRGAWARISPRMTCSVELFEPTLIDRCPLSNRPSRRQPSGTRQLSFESLCIIVARALFGTPRCYHNPMAWLKAGDDKSTKWVKEQIDILKPKGLVSQHPTAGRAGDRGRSSQSTI